MPPATHLFVAPSSASFGETILGIRLAHELHARGDRIVFLASVAAGPLLAGAPFQVGKVDRMTGAMETALPAVVRDLGPRTVVLVDLLMFLINASARGIAPDYLDELRGTTVVALDIWDMRRPVHRLDTHMQDVDITFPPSAHTVVPRRMVPVPFVRPDVDGGYCALPARSALGDEDRARMRAQLGMDASHRLVVLTTANFQSRQLVPQHQPVRSPVLARIARLCQAAGPDVRVLHVGPQAVEDAGHHYRHHAQLAPGVFQRLIHAADVVVTPNQSATTISTALALGVPAVAVICTRTATTAPDQPRTPPFRVFPLGFSELMAGLVVDNPYCAAVPAVELHPGDAVVETVRALCFDAAARDAARDRAGAYLDVVRRLPSGADRFQRLVEG